MAVTANCQKWQFGLLILFYILCGGVALYADLYFLVTIPFVVILLGALWRWSSFFFFLLLFSLPFSVEYQFSPSLGSDLPDEMLMVLVSFVFLARWIYSPESIQAKTIRHPLLILLFVCLTWMIVAVFFSSHPLVSVKYLLAKSWYIGAFVLAPLILFRNKKAIIIAAQILAVGILLATIIILYRHYQTGFSFATVNEAVYPFFRNHVNYSAMLVCIIPILLAFVLLDAKKSAKYLGALCIAIVLIALFFSYARGAWLALATGMAAWWLIKKRLLLAAYITTIIITITAFFWIKKNDRYLSYAHDYKTTVFHKDFSEHIVATYKLKDVSTAERFYRWIAGVRMIKDNWLTGYGPNTFYEKYKEYAIPAYKTWVSDNDDHSTVHNYFLLTAIEQGLPGLFFLLLLLGALFWYAQHLYHRIKDKFYKIAALSTGVILCMIVTVNFLSDLIETDKIGSLFFLSIALLVIIDKNTRGSEPASHIQSIP